MSKFQSVFVSTFVFGWIVSWLTFIWLPPYRSRLFVTGLFCILTAIIFSGDDKKEQK